jgi:hypothetical protein
MITLLGSIVRLALLVKRLYKEENKLKCHVKNKPVSESNSRPIPDNSWCS